MTDPENETIVDVTPNPPKNKQGDADYYGGKASDGEEPHGAPPADDNVKENDSGWE